MLEKGLIVALIAVVILAAVPRVGCNMQGTFGHIGAAFHPGTHAQAVCK